MEVHMSMKHLFFFGSTEWRMESEVGLDTGGDAFLGRNREWAWVRWDVFVLNIKAFEEGNLFCYTLLF